MSNSFWETVVCVMVGATIGLLAHKAMGGPLDNFYWSEYDATRQQLIEKTLEEVNGYYEDTIDTCNQATNEVNWGARDSKTIQIVAICEALADEYNERNRVEVEFE